MTMTTAPSINQRIDQRITSQHLSRRQQTLLLAAGLIIALLPLCQPFVTKDDEAFMYPYSSIVDLLPALFCLITARRHLGFARAQWSLFAGFLLCRGLSYWPNVLAQHNLISPHLTQLTGSAVSMLGLCLALLSITAFSSGTTRAIRTIDILITLLLGALYITTNITTEASTYHLYLSFGAVVFCTAIAAAAYFRSPPLFRTLFTRTVMLFFLVRLVSIFFTNIVNVLWIRKGYDLPFDLLFSIPSLFFCWYVARHWNNAAIPRNGIRTPRPLLRSLLPSMLAVAGVVLAPFAFQPHVLLISSAVLLFVIGYATRTHLLYSLLMREQRDLLTHAGRLEQLAMQDALTEIPNRRWFETVAEEVLRHTPSAANALILLDIDRFKEVNDSFGHRAGDAVLRTIAALLREVTTLPGACCARIGGDEFAILLPASSELAAFTLAERIRDAVHHFSFPFPHKVSVSIGIAISTEACTLISLLERADAGLYKAKQNGRNLTTPAESPQLLELRKEISAMN